MRVLVRSSIEKSKDDSAGYMLTMRTCFDKLKKAWCDKHQIRESEVVLRLDGSDLPGEATPESVNAQLDEKLHVEAIVNAGTQLSFEVGADGASSDAESSRAAEEPERRGGKEEPAEEKEPAEKGTASAERKTAEGEALLQEQSAVAEKGEASAPPAAHPGSADDEEIAGMEKEREQEQETPQPEKRGRRRDDAGARGTAAAEEEEPPAKTRRRRRSERRKRALPVELGALQQAVQERKPFKLREVDGKGSLVGFVPDYEDYATAQRLFQELRSCTEFSAGQITMFGKTHPEPRLRFAVGKDVKYSRQAVHGLPWDRFPELAAAKKRVEESLQKTFNSALVNLYRDGQDKVSMHQDDEAMYGLRPTIASLSLGSTRNFHFKEKLEGGETCKLALQDGDLIVMAGSCQEHLLHGVPRSAHAVGERINVTFRLINSTEAPREETGEAEDKREAAEATAAPARKRRRFLGKLLKAEHDEQPSGQQEAWHGQPTAAADEPQDPAALELQRMHVNKDMSLNLVQAAIQAGKEPAWCVAELRARVQNGTTPMAAALGLLGQLKHGSLLYTEVDPAIEVFAARFHLNQRDAGGLQEALGFARVGKDEVLAALATHLEGGSLRSLPYFLSDLKRTGKPWLSRPRPEPADAPRVAEERIEKEADGAARLEAAPAGESRRPEDEAEQKKRDVEEDIAAAKRNAERAAEALAEARRAAKEEEEEAAAAKRRAEASVREKLEASERTLREHEERVEASKRTLREDEERVEASKRTLREHEERVEEARKAVEAASREEAALEASEQ